MANQNGLLKIKRALLSVSDKDGIVEFARELKKYDVEIISTGGTARVLRDAGIEVKDVSDVTGFPEMMDGRVKTLHPKIHGGILALRDNFEHIAAMQEHGIEPIDMVVVNLYPFEQTIENEDVTLEEAIEQIDIGGPAMIRSASKNFHSVTVVTSPVFYELLSKEMERNKGAISFVTRIFFASLAFMQTSAYDMAITNYLTNYIDEELEIPDSMNIPTEEDLQELADALGLSNVINAESNGNGFGLYDEDEDEDFDFDELEDFDEDDEEIELYDDETLELEKINDLRYGENPHQKAALYDTGEIGGIANAELLGGKEMSFNNYIDADAAWRLVCEFDDIACAIIKHTNPAGVALGKTTEEAYRRALETDPVSAFGGIVAFNQTVEADTAKAVTEIFTEVIVAPNYDEDALEILRAKKNLRILQVDTDGYDFEGEIEYKQISGGMLIQTSDNHVLDPEDLKVVTERKPTDEEIKAMLFAWKVCKHTKSNAIVYASEGQTVGVGAGQMSRVDSVKIGAMRARIPLEGTVLASDAFFPFRDGVDEAAKHGITAIIQPGGSMRDEEVIAAANEHNLAMVFTGIRHFKH
jgi:phosphoribosylaminoimidazolecarboxamide formyltransferase/IMP cyclohydrolase